MGREIRRVPANWEHPVDSNGNYRAMYDRDFDTAARAWVNNCIAWDNGTHEDILENPALKREYPFYWQYTNEPPPDPEGYRPKFITPADWYQVYETVSQGTPVTPPFATKEELIDYLVEHGDFWDQRRRSGGWKRENAQQFVADEWSPSMMMKITPDSVQINEPRDGFPD